MGLSVSSTMDDICADCNPSTKQVQLSTPVILQNPTLRNCADSYAKADNCMKKHKHSASKCSAAFKDLKVCMDQDQNLQ